MVEFYFFLKIIFCILAIVIYIIKNKLDKKFKQNCFECKNYKLITVSSLTNQCIYACYFKNRCDKHHMNNKEKFIKCKEFEGVN